MEQKQKLKKAVRILKRRMKKFLFRHRAAILLCTTLLIGLIAGTVLGVKASDYIRSETVNDYGRHRTYTLYTVERGDTVWSIAEDLIALNPEYNDIRQYVSVIQRMNNISGTELKSGQMILIPYYTNDGDTAYDELCEKYGIKQ